MAEKTRKQSEKGLAEKQWNARCVAVTLLNECYYRENQTGNTADNTRSYADMLQSAPSHLSAVLADKAAFVKYRPSFVSYCKAVFILLKAAFRHKMPKVFVVIGW